MAPTRPKAKSAAARMRMSLSVNTSVRAPASPQELDDSQPPTLAEELDAAAAEARATRAASAAAAVDAATTLASMADGEAGAAAAATNGTKEPTPPGTADASVSDRHDAPTSPAAELTLQQKIDAGHVPFSPSGPRVKRFMSETYEDLTATADALLDAADVTAGTGAHVRAAHAPRSPPASAPAPVRKLPVRAVFFDYDGTLAGGGLSRALRGGVTAADADADDDALLARRLLLLGSGCGGGCGGGLHAWGWAVTAAVAALAVAGVLQPSSQQFAAAEPGGAPDAVDAATGGGGGGGGGGGPATAPSGVVAAARWWPALLATPSAAAPHAPSPAAFLASAVAAGAAAFVLATLCGWNARASLAANADVFAAGARGGWRDRVVADFGGPERLGRLRAALRRLRARGVACCVLSTSWAPLTARQWRAYLVAAGEAVGLGFAAGDVIALADPGGTTPANKGRAIRQRMRALGLAPGSALLVDDSARSRATCAGVCGALGVASGEASAGLGAEDLAAILARADA